MDVAVTIDRISPVPLYHQLAHQLKDAVEHGALPKGAFLDNELELADRWQVSRPTVRRAIQELVDDGLLVRRRGVGTQVVNDQVRRPLTLSSFHDDLVADGRRPVTDLIELERTRPPSDVAGDLGLGARSQVVHIVRRRSAGRRPLAVMRNWLIVDVAGDLTADELERSGLYALIRARGVRPHYAIQELGAKAADVDEAELLGVAVGAPLLTMRRVMQDVTGRPVEVGDHVYDAAHYSVEMAVVEN